MFEKKNPTEFDCVIVGGGLAGGLLLHALKNFQPELRVLLIEQSDCLGGNHTWCFHSSDVPENSGWLKPLISKTWQRQKVAFPDYERVLDHEYNAIRSEDFAQFLTQNYKNSVLLNSPVVSLTASTVVLGSGQTLTAYQVVDARGWKSGELKDQGYQKFVGWDVKLRSPHGLDYVFLKDARVLQRDGYRFFYLLPWSETRLLVEDTYYSNKADLDIQSVGDEVQKYIQAQGWEIESIERKEFGCLALPFAKSDRASVLGGDEPICLGAASKVFQPVTGYTFPTTVARVYAIARAPVFEWKAILEKEDRLQQRTFRYFYLLNRLLFLAASPDQRYRVLQRFYKLPEGLIARFYRGDLKGTDYMRILIGKPPVAIHRAIKHLWR